MKNSVRPNEKAAAVAAAADYASSLTKKMTRTKNKHKKIEWPAVADLGFKNSLYMISKIFFLDLTIL